MKELQEFKGRKHFERRCTQRGISENMIYNCLKNGVEEKVYKQCSKKIVRLNKIHNKYITILYNPGTKQLITAWLNDEFETIVKKYANDNNITVYKAISNLFTLYNSQEAV